MTADRTRRAHGFFSTALLFWRKWLVSWDLAIAVLAGVAYYLATPAGSELHAALLLSGAGLAVAPAMIGVVVAALAIAVAVMDDRFLSVVSEALERHGRIEGFVFPYWLVTGVGVAAFLGGIAIGVCAPGLSPQGLRLAGAVELLVIVWTLLGVFNLVASLQALGVSRATWVSRGRQAASDDEEVRR